MPLIHNNSPASAAPAANTFQSPFSATVDALRTVRDVDQQVKSEALAQARKLVTEAVADGLNQAAAEIKAEKRSANAEVQLRRLGFGKSTVPESTTLTAGQFSSRGAHDLAALHGTYGVSELENAVTKPIVQELKAAGFTDASFKWTKAHVNGYWFPVLDLTVNLPKV